MSVSICIRSGLVGVLLALAGPCALADVGTAETPRQPIPDKLVVLTFDDGNQSDLNTVAPILKECEFGATFFITSGWLGREKRLTWSQVKELQEAGFEIGSHCLSHPNLLRLSAPQIHNEIAGFDRACAEHGIAKSTSFSYPGGHFDRRVLAVLKEEGYTAARRGRDPEWPLEDNGGNGRAYVPGEDDPLLIPSTLTRGIEAQEDERVVRALKEATAGQIAVLTYHGVPDVNRHCSTSVERFRKDMNYLKESGATVVALRDLSRYVDLSKRPADPYAPIVKRLGMRVENARCGTSGAIPSFSWELDGNGWTQKQVAYRILVASSRELLARNYGDLWDSGKVPTDQKKGIPYAGQALKSARSFWWKMQVWNRRNGGEIDRISLYQPDELVAELSKSRPGPFSDAKQVTSEASAAFDPLEIPDTDEGVPGAGPLRRTDWFRGVWRKRRGSWLDKTEAQKGSVVFLGDSITQGWGDGFKGAFGNLKVANRGITGDTSRGLLLRLKEDVVDVEPTAVVVMIGANDLAEKAKGEVVFNNVKLIIGKLQEHYPRMPILLCETFPCAPDNYRPVAEIQKINSLYEKTWSNDPQVTIVKTYGFFAGNDGASLPKFMPDRVHPNTDGYALWAKILRPLFSAVGLGDYRGR